MASDDVFRIDSHDPRVTPEGQFNWGEMNTYPRMFNHSGLITNVAGANMTVRFSGTVIAVYGWVANEVYGSQIPRSQYYVDDELEGEYTATIPVGDDLYDVEFFRSDRLSPGNHVLVVENVQAQDFFTIDYFEVNGDPRGVAPSPSPGSSSISPSGASSGSSGVPTPSSSSDGSVIEGGSGDPSGPAASDGRSAPVGAIVGGVIGGLFLIVLLVLGMYYLRNQARRAADKRKVDLDLGDVNANTGAIAANGTLINPFDVHGFRNSNMDVSFQGFSPTDITSPSSVRYTTKNGGDMQEPLAAPPSYEAATSSSSTPPSSPQVQKRQ